ncbi:hypothetical protein PNEG_02312 [Pneumocystis murina B123]|uniref:DUF3020 domain-containing protein n=1 Tax=Pneumocystis murina (strain B123) TaxID=1069680 RepID=M7NQ24_PNEMU|nr:hypothetical protein PNEG_02312 [Pneumocystis murina B123]EMR09362.1 hypothetical protein PNEG_02312 [Pneumocystis murina B123]
MGEKIVLSRDLAASSSVSFTGMGCMGEEAVKLAEHEDKNDILKLTTSNSELLVNVERNSMMEKIRQENRERKKRWRQANEDRNKDNDLRCRVNKRAHKLYGKEQSLAKSKWIEDEFLRRQLKRKDRERKRFLESHIMTTNRDINNTGFNAVEFSQTFLTNLFQNLVSFNHTIPFSFRSALFSFSTNPNFLRIITTLFASLTDNISSTPQIESSLENSHPTDDATQLYRSLLFNLLPSNNDSFFFSSSSIFLPSENVHNALNTNQSSSSAIYSLSSTTSQPSFTYRSSDPITSMGFPPVPVDFSQHK